jgi:hypothetical protein
MLLIGETKIDFSFSVIRAVLNECLSQIHIQVLKKYYLFFAFKVQTLFIIFCLDFRSGFLKPQFHLYFFCIKSHLIF